MDTHRACYLITNQITHAILAEKPKLVDRYCPNSGRYAEIIEIVVEGSRTGYRLLTWEDRHTKGPDYRPDLTYTLTQLRLEFAAWTASESEAEATWAKSNCVTA